MVKMVKMVQITDEAKRFKIFRKKLKLSQNDMSNFLGINQSYISKFESGEYIIPVEVIKKLKLKYHLNYDWFFDGILPIISDTSKDRKDTLNYLGGIKENYDILIKKIEKLEENIKIIARKNNQ
jgi:transcriptional regulator with XRE-family HTH domain